MLQTPSLFLEFPADLVLAQPGPNPKEREAYLAIRRRFARDPERVELPEDKLRAFRLMRGKRRYLEVGSGDKGNVAYVASLLRDDAFVMELDAMARPDAERLLRETLVRDATHLSITGDSGAPEIAQRVREIAGRTGFDGVFIDANHTADYVLSDYANYGELVAPDGYVFFYDALWEGSDTSKGVADALEMLSRFAPIYLIEGVRPVRRWTRTTRRGDVWGGMAVMRGVDLHGLRPPRTAAD